MGNITLGALLALTLASPPGDDPERVCFSDPDRARVSDVARAGLSGAARASVSDAADACLLDAARVCLLSRPDRMRLYGRVLTTDGDVLEGYLRWDRNEGSAADFLDAVKEIPVELVREAERLDPLFAEEMRRARSLVAFGVRITWDEDDLSGPPRSPAPIRFGHVASLEPLDRRRARLTLRSGEDVELIGSSTDLGVGMRGLIVELPRGDSVDVSWSHLARVDFVSAPDDAPPPRSPRLHGTVTTWSGHELTGYIAWDRDEILGSDVLDGSEGAQDYEIAFDDIEAIAREDRRGARVFLRTGEQRVLRGTNDVDRDNRGIEISVVSFGRAIVPWGDFEAVRFHPPDTAPVWPEGAPQGPISGTVHALDGRVVAGAIRWGNDEEWWWETLDGWSGETELAVEFAAIRSIERDGPDAVRVTLRDGQTLRLEGTDDVGEGNRGLFVKPDERPRRLIRWADVDRVVFAR